MYLRSIIVLLFVMGCKTTTQPSSDVSTTVISVNQKHYILTTSQDDEEKIDIELATDLGVSFMHESAKYEEISRKGNIEIRTIMNRILELREAAGMNTVVSSSDVRTEYPNDPIIK